MKSRNMLLTLALFFACGLYPAAAQGEDRACPISIDHIDLSYGHHGSQSKPELRVNFTNHGDKAISTVIFALSVIDSGGAAHPYQDELTYSDGLEAGKEKVFAWTLSPESVDIHRAGETVGVQEVDFTDSTVWKDDNADSCVLTVDYHPR